MHKAAACCGLKRSDTPTHTHTHTHTHTESFKTSKSSPPPLSSPHYGNKNGSARTFDSRATGETKMEIPGPLKAERQEVRFKCKRTWKPSDARSLLFCKFSVPDQERDFKAPAAIGVELSQLSLLSLFFMR